MQPKHEDHHKIYKYFLGGPDTLHEVYNDMSHEDKTYICYAYWITIR